MVMNDALRDAQDASQAVRDINDQLERARIRRRDALLKAYNEGHTQSEIADICDLHIKTVQAELKVARNK